MPSQRGLVVQSFWGLRSFPLVPLDPLLFMLASFFIATSWPRLVLFRLARWTGEALFATWSPARPRSHRVEFFVYYHGFGYAAGFSEGFGGTEIGAGRISQ